MIRLLSSLAITALLASCASGPRPMPRAQIERALAGAPGEAQPSKIVSAEIAFARMARDEGQWTAFQAFAATGALIHGRNGPIDAAPWLAEQRDPAEAVQWAPRSIWMSCDGALAVSQGRFEDPEGLVGTFVTVWRRQGNNDYRWTYDVAAPDNPQPAPVAPRADLEGDAIVVTALDSIEGHVADCPRRGLEKPAPPMIEVADGIRTESQVSRDRTLRWRWEQAPQGDRRVIVDFLQNGIWERALDQSLPVSPEE